MAHTETPLRWERAGCRIIDQKGHTIAYVNVAYTAEDGLNERGNLIVRAVNCHDELVAALQASQNRLADYLAVQNIRNDNGSRVESSIETIRKQLDVNTEVLRKANNAI